MPRVLENALPLHHRVPRKDVLGVGSRPVFIPVDELLTPGFVSRTTRYSDFSTLLSASHFTPEQIGGLEAKSDDHWETFIRRISVFATWNAMLKDARGEWIMHRLGLYGDV